jgi:hypothetical protein
VLESDRGGRSPRGGQRFILYVEGPRDRSILRAWSYRLLPSAGRRLLGGAVILGGRQPARALDHFHAESDARALCLLDRDDGGGPQPSAKDAPGLEFFTWSRRHIESYLLVPAAIRRALDLPDNDHRVDRVLRSCLPAPSDEDAYRQVDAKRMLGPQGELARVLGRPLPLPRIARATRETELHPDVHALFDRLRSEFEVSPIVARKKAFGRGPAGDQPPRS